MQCHRRSAQLVGWSLAVFALVLNATTWGLAWWPIRLLTEAGLHSLWATALIYASATVGIVARPFVAGEDPCAETFGP